MKKLESRYPAILPFSLGPNKFDLIFQRDMRMLRSSIAVSDGKRKIPRKIHSPQPAAITP
jgi:hypothetical protein